MKLKYLSALVGIGVLLPTAAFAVSLNQTRSGKVASAQLPLPFGAPGPIIPGPQCSPQYQSLLKLQIEGLKRLARSEGETLCATLEGADQFGVDKLIDPKLLQQPQQVQSWAITLDIGSARSTPTSSWCATGDTLACR